MRVEQVADLIVTGDINLDILKLDETERGQEYMVDRTICGSDIYLKNHIKMYSSITIKMFRNYIGSLNQLLAMFTKNSMCNKGKQYYQHCPMYMFASRSLQCLINSPDNTGAMSQFLPLKYPSLINSPENTGAMSHHCLLPMSDSVANHCLLHLLVQKRRQFKKHK